MQLLEQIIIKEKIEEEDNFEDFVNPKLRVETPAVGVPDLRILQRGDIIQLERRGYFIVDVPAFKPKQPVVLINVPDGKSKDMSVLSSKVARK